MKKYTNPSSDTITILSGLDDVDQVFTEFVSVLDRTIRNGRDCELHQITLVCLLYKTKTQIVGVRLKAIRTAIAFVSGAYKTGLVSYFTHRDLFPSLMKVGWSKKSYGYQWHAKSSRLSMTPTTRSKFWSRSSSLVCSQIIINLNCKILISNDLTTLWTKLRSRRS